MTLIDYIDKINTKIDLDSSFIAPSRTDFAEGFLGNERLISKQSHACIAFLAEFYKTVFGWLPANPSKPELAEAIKCVFVFTDKEQTDHGNFVNTLEGHNKFKIDLTQNRNVKTFFWWLRKDLEKLFISII
jgi:hypothetical protein